MKNNGMLYLLGLVGLVIMAWLFVTVFPWYHQDLPMKVEQKIYHPGGETILVFDRVSRIHLNAQVIRELVRLEGQGEDRIEHEVAKVNEWVEMSKGRRRIALSYFLPKQCNGEKQPCVFYDNNSYRWQGCMKYEVLGIKRHWYFESEPFEIQVK